MCAVYVTSFRCYGLSLLLPLNSSLLSLLSLLLPPFFLSLLLPPFHKAQDANSNGDYESARNLGRASLIWNIFVYVFYAVAITVLVIVVVVRVNCYSIYGYC